MAPPKCPVCSAAHVSCGPPAVVTPVDIPHEIRRPTVAELAEYEVEVRGHTATMQLSAEDAERLGAKRVGDVKVTEPVPVPSKLENGGLVTSQTAKGESEGDEKAAAAPESKKRVPANKSV